MILYCSNWEEIAFEAIRAGYSASWELKNEYDLSDNEVELQEISTYARNEMNQSIEHPNEVAKLEVLMSIFNPITDSLDIVVHTMGMNP